MDKSSREDVIKGYRIFLGREPESEAVIELKIGYEKKKCIDSFLRSPEHKDKAKKSNVDILVMGNCTAKVYESIINSASSLKCKSVFLTPETQQAILDGREFIAHYLTSAKIVAVVHGYDLLKNKLQSDFGVPADKFRSLPAIAFRAFHPDMLYLLTTKGVNIGDYNSRVAAFSYMSGLSPNEAIDLFNEKTYKALGYFDLLRSDRNYISRQGQVTGLPLNTILEKWLSKKECFMHSINHPKLGFLSDIMFSFLKKEGIEFNSSVSEYLFDRLSPGPSWQPYPEVAKFFGMSSDYLFKLGTSTNASVDEFFDKQVKGFDLKGFVEWQYSQFSSIKPDEIKLSDSELNNFEIFKSNLHSFKSSAARDVPQNHKANPYKELPDYQFWRRSVSSLSMEQVDPVTNPRFGIKKEDKVATAGSCFAQHIAKTLSKSGFNYFVTENSSEPDAVDRNFGVYSARYGNIYSTKQLLQLFDRAYQRFSPVEEAWERDDGRLVDPYRPQIEPEGYKSLSELLASRRTHLALVRQMFEEMDVFVFTLGLTEIWRSKIDGAVFPLAPGVVAGKMDDTRYEFANLSAEDIRTDLQIFIDQLYSVNPRVKVLLTVSPVPLMATYENRHVLSSTTLSKSVLRVVADEICRANPHVDYFPSYEIITGNYTRGSFFEEDLRSVRPEGVAQVMSLFLKHYGGEGQTGSAELERAQASNSRHVAEAVDVAGIVCDEEALDR